MKETKYEKTMRILEKEERMELMCAHKTYDLLCKTRNPLKRMRLRKSIEIFMNHSVGISNAIHTIKREIEKS